MNATQTQTKYFSNRYAGTCQTCRERVAENAGFTGKENGKYVCYCKAHVPAKIEASAARTMTADGFVRTGYEPENLPILRSLPGARWDPDNKAWAFSLDMGDRERVLEIADKLELAVAPELRVTVTTEQAAVAENVGLYPFQVKGVNWLAQRTRSLLGDDMGLGKTVQALVSLPKDAATLVIAPAAVKYNWRNEAAKWTPNFKVTVLEGRNSFRFPQAGEIVIINYDILPASLEKAEPATIAEIAKLHIIADECHRCKNYKTARSKRVSVLTKNAKAVIGLTGTPLMNRPGDLYGVLSSLNMAYETFGGWGNYMRLFNAQQDRWGGIQWGTPDASVPERLRRVMIRRKKDDVLPDLPALTITTLAINGVSDSLSRRMDAFEEEWGDVMAAGDLPPFEEFSSIRAALAESRIPAMMEMAEDHEEQNIPLVIASAHTAPINALAEREGWAVITGATKAEDRAGIVTRFQAGELKGLGITILAGGVGITLTRAAKMLFVDLDWVPANNAQCQDRIRRIGQTAKKVEIVRMVSNHTLDQHVMSLLAEKIAMVDAAVEAEVVAVIAAPVKAETEEEYKTRMAEVYSRPLPVSPAREQRAENLHNRLVAKKELPELTPERTEAIKVGFAYLLSVCDGARDKDGSGFNKPDQYLSRWLASYGLENEREVRTAQALLQKYRKQLAAYTAIFA